MIELLFTLISLMVFAVFIAFALWFGAALLVVIFISGAFFAVYFVLRGYYLRWKYGNMMNSHPQNQYSETVTKTTIIDAEYKDISEK